MGDTTDHILVTIIVPVYNAEKYIEQLLQNITAQTFRNFELLIVDGQSSDGTLTIAKAASARDSRIRLVSEKDKGIYDAMNRGIEKAKAGWIYFMGADDALANEQVLQEISSQLLPGTDLLYGNVTWMPDNFTEKGICTARDLLDKNINHQRIFYRKELFQQYGGYDLQYLVASDHELNIRFFCNSQVVKKYIDYNVAVYHSGGFSANKTDTVFWNNFKQIFRQHFSGQVPVKEMYRKLGWYCRYQIDNRNYARAFVLFWDVFFHSFSPGFVLLTIRQLFKSFGKPAS